MQIRFRRIPALIFLFFTGLMVQWNASAAPIQPAAERPETYIPYLKNKSVALFANHTSMAGNEHLLDLLIRHDIKVRKIFTPEHGFRGTGDAGEKINNSVDEKTGIPIISLYGNKRRPTVEELKDIDIMVFDIQDVGVRFYTYISSLEEYMIAAIEAGKPLIILDRPNPNGFYIDGPVLEPAYRSFVGMQPVPVVYGMTIGEYAKMILGEKWVDPNKIKSSGKGFNLVVIPCANYTRSAKYVLPVKPSPNLPNMAAIYLYPSICFFEGTVLSEGRGTDKPFQIFGHPLLPDTLKAFTPKSTEGAKNPKLLNQLCYGWDLSASPEKILQELDGQLQLKWLIEAYRLFPDKDRFFILPAKNNYQPQEIFFNKLAGNSTLFHQIQNGISEEEIRKSWEPALKQFKEIRKKYLIYSE